MTAFKKKKFGTAIEPSLYILDTTNYLIFVCWKYMVHDFVNICELVNMGVSVC